MSKPDIRLLLNAYMEMGDVNGYAKAFAKYYDILAQ